MDARLIAALALGLALALPGTRGATAAEPDEKPTPLIQTPEKTPKQLMPKTVEVDPKPQIQLPEKTRKRLMPKNAEIDPRPQVEVPPCRPLPVEFRLTTRTITKRIVASRPTKVKLRYEIGAIHNHLYRVTVNGTLDNGEPFASLRANLEPGNVWYRVTWNNLDYKQGGRFEFHAFGDNRCQDEEWHIEAVARLPAR